MRKIILILLCLPLFIFPQEERKYEKTISFSTLGFGQIPVRGLTKYVAIIEGFIGWFMLSIFLVSVLSQMMSV